MTSQRDILRLDICSGIAAIRVITTSPDYQEYLGNGLHGDESNTLCYVSGTYSGNSWSLTDKQIENIKEAYSTLQGKISYKLTVENSRLWDDYELQVAYSGDLDQFLTAVTGCKSYLYYDMLFNTTLDNSVLIIEE